MGQSAALANLIYILCLPIFGLLVAAASGINPRISLVVAVVLLLAGFVSLVVAKLPNFSRGQWLNFGPSCLQPNRRWLWWVSLLLLLSGVVLLVGSAVGSALQ